MTIATTSRALREGLQSHLGYHLPMKPVPFKRNCFETHGAMTAKASNRILTLRWHAMVSHRRQLAKLEEEQQQRLSQVFRGRGHGYVPQPPAARALPPPHPPTATKKKRVRFAHIAAVYTRSVPPEDTDHSWYRPEHYRRFEAENRDTVAAAYASRPLDPEQHTVLGLEHYLAGRKHMIARRLKTMQHSAMVLEMYDVQRCSNNHSNNTSNNSGYRGNAGSFDPEMVRRVSERFSRGPVDRALARAATGRAA